MKMKYTRFNIPVKSSRLLLLSAFIVVNCQLFCQVSEYKLSSALLDSLTIEYHSELNRNSTELNKSVESIIVITIEELSDTVVLRIENIRDIMTVLHRSFLIDKCYIVSFYKLDKLSCFIVMDKMKGIISNNDEALREFIKANFYPTYKEIYESKLDTLITTDGSVIIGYRYTEVVRIGKRLYWRVSICDGKVVKKSAIIG